MLPALVGALLGIPGGIAIYSIPETGTTTTIPAATSLIAVVAAALTCDGWEDRRSTPHWQRLHSVFAGLQR